MAPMLLTRTQAVLLTTLFIACAFLVMPGCGVIKPDPGKIWIWDKLDRESH